MLRADFIFSYWIFAWFLFYIFDIIKFSPKFAILIGIIENIGLLFYIIYHNAPYSIIWKFIIVIMFQKALLLYIVRKDIMHVSDILFTLGLFVIYLLWLHIHNTSFFEIINKINTSLIQNKNETPGIYIINYILKYI